MKDRFGAFLKTLTNTSEIYAIFGRGYPHSFYKAYVRATPRGKWWRVKTDGRAISYDPRAEAKRFPLEGRLGAIDGPVAYFLLFEHIQSEELARLRTRIVEVCGETRHHLQLTDGPPVFTKPATTAPPFVPDKEF